MIGMRCNMTFWSYDATGGCVGITWWQHYQWDNCILWVKMIKIGHNKTTLVKGHHWYQHYMTPMASSMVHDTGTRPGTSTCSKSHVIPLNNHQHDKCNGVIDGTINIMWQETCYCHVHSKSLICPSNVTYKPYMPITSHTHIRQLCQYICFIWVKCDQWQCDQEHWYTYISHYWHISQNKYACQFVTICSPALLLYFHADPTLHYI